jgi:DNA-binding beta-propeller fold protein YncE
MADGELTQSACLSHDGHDPACPAARALQGGAGIAVSPDGRNVYVAASRPARVAAFAVDSRRGSLTQLSGDSGCATVTGSQGRCARGTALAGARGVAVSGDGRWVYVAAEGQFLGRRGGIAVFWRNPTTGALTQTGCIASAPVARCTRGRALARPAGVAVSADGRSAYSASPGRTGAGGQSPGGGIAVFLAG